MKMRRFTPREKKLIWWLMFVIIATVANIHHNNTWNEYPSRAESLGKLVAVKKGDLLQIFFQGDITNPVGGWSHIDTFKFVRASTDGKEVTLCRNGEISKWLSHTVSYYLRGIVVRQNPDYKWVSAGSGC